MNDPELVSGLLDGNPLAIELLRTWIRSAFKPYYSRLKAELEDLEQDILYELTRSLEEGRFARRSRLRTYVTSYVHHKCIDRLRALDRRTWVSLEDLELPAEAFQIGELEE